MTSLIDSHFSDEGEVDGPSDRSAVGESNSAGAGSQVRFRKRLLVAIAVTAAVFSAAGVGAATLIKSPAQVAAETRAPKATQLTAQVQLRVLTNTVISRGTVAATAQFQITPPAESSGAATTGQIITAIHTSQGKTVKAGTSMLEISGRPLFAFQGSIPVYRDLKPGEHGPDVAQLQRGLADLGYSLHGDGSGTYGPGTKRAVTAFYRHLGFDTVPASSDEASRLQAAADLVTTDQQLVTAIRQEMSGGTTAGGTGTGSAGGSTGGATTHADYLVPAYAHSSDGGTGTATAGGTSTGSSGGGATGTGTLAQQLASAKQQLSQAKTARAALVATTGPVVPAAEIVFLPTFPATVASLSSRVGDTVKAPLLVLSTGRLGVTSQLTPDQSALLKPGMKVTLTNSAAAGHATGHVTSVGAAELPTGNDSSSGGTGTGGSGAAGTGVPMATVSIATDKALPSGWAGADVMVSITSSSSGKPVLVVPESAVTTSADGRTSVEKVTSGIGTPPLVRVYVTPGLSGSGYVSVKPLAAGTLDATDQVMVGAQSQ